MMTAQKAPTPSGMRPSPTPSGMQSSPTQPGMRTSSTTNSNAGSAGTEPHRTLASGSSAAGVTQDMLAQVLSRIPTQVNTEEGTTKSASPKPRPSPPSSLAAAMTDLLSGRTPAGAPFQSHVSGSNNNLRGEFARTANSVTTTRSGEASLNNRITSSVHTSVPAGRTTDLPVGAQSGWSGGVVAGRNNVVAAATLDSMKWQQQGMGTGSRSNVTMNANMPASDIAQQFSFMSRTPQQSTSDYAMRNSIPHQHLAPGVSVPSVESVFRQASHFTDSTASASSTNVPRVGSVTGASREKHAAPHEIGANAVRNQLTKENRLVASAQPKHSSGAPGELPTAKSNRRRRSSKHSNASVPSTATATAVKMPPNGTFGVGLPKPLVEMLAPGGRELSSLKLQKLKDATKIVQEMDSHVIEPLRLYNPSQLYDLMATIAEAWKNSGKAAWKKRINKIKENARGRKKPRNQLDESEKAEIADLLERIRKREEWEQGEKEKEKREKEKYSNKGVTRPTKKSRS